MAMKRLLVLLSLPLFCCAQNPQVNISLGPKSIFFDSSYKKDAVEAFKIASDILNSSAFQDAIKKSSFVYPNHCLTCKILDERSDHHFFGQTVLDSLYKHNVASLNLDLEENEPKGALGSTCPYWDNEDTISRANYQAIYIDMKELPFKYRLAVNLCHEYMHYIGFCHPDAIDRQPDDDTPAPIAYRDDVAYKAGWVAYFIAVKMANGAGK